MDMDFYVLGRAPLLVVALSLPMACENGSGSNTEGGNDTENSTATDNGSATENGDTISADETGTDTDNPPEGLAGACPVGESVGRFDVILEEAYSAIDGEVRETLVQTTIITVAAEEGECRLLKRENPFCDPPCSGGEACTSTAQCAVFPERITVGTVTITGLEVPLAMEPAADQRYFETDLPHPVITAGAEIELTADGLDLSGFGFGALSLVTTELVVAAETPLDISWDPENADALIRIEVNIDQHGISPTTLFCDVPDTGSYSVPASLVDALMNSGVSGFPSANIYRQTVDSATISAGCVEFRVRARTPATVEVEGHTACNGPGECPEGQTCNIPIQTCE